MRRGSAGRMRGGLVMQGASQPSAAAPRAGGRVPAAPPFVQPVDGDTYVRASASLHRVEWSLAFMGFVLYVFVITTYRIAVGDAAMVAALVGLAFVRTKVRFPSLLLWMVVLLAWCGLGIFQSRYSGLVYEEWVALGKLCLIVLVAVNVLQTRSNLRAFLLLYVLFYSTHPARGAIFNYLGGYTLFGRALWNYVFANSNDLAAITLLILSLAAGLLVTERRKSLFWWSAVAATVILPVVILMTKSRGVFLGLAVFGILAMLGGRRRLRSITMGLVFVAAILMLAPKGSLSRLGGLEKAVNENSIAAADPEGSAEQRYKIWTVAWAIIADHPITGVGWGAYPRVHEEYSPRVDPSGMSRGRRDTHSTYFNVLAEIGYPGLLIFLTVVGGTALNAERIRRRCRAVMPAAAQQLYLLELGLLGYMVAGVFGSYSRISFLYLHLAIMYAASRACQADLAVLRPQAGHRR